MRGRAPILVLVGAFAIAIAGCGSDGSGTIPRGDAEEMLGALAAAQTSLQSGHCEVLVGDVNHFSELVQDLPSSVEEPVRQELDRATENLRKLADEPSQCGATTGASGAQGVDTTDEDTGAAAEVPSTPETTEETTQEPDRPSGGPGNGGGSTDITGEPTEQPTETQTAPPSEGTGGGQGASQGGGSSGQNGSGGTGTDSGGITGE